MENPKFGKVRKIIEPDGATLYCAADVAKALGYAEPKSAVRQHCRWGVKRTIPHPQSPDKEIEQNTARNPLTLVMGSRAVTVSVCQSISNR
jgi:LSD1 subclass zinc finger protein